MANGASSDVSARFSEHHENAAHHGAAESLLRMVFWKNA